MAHLDGAPLSAFAMDPIRLVRRADMLADVQRSVTSYTDAGSSKTSVILGTGWACQSNLGVSREEVAASHSAS